MRSIVGLLRNRQEAEHTIHELLDKGFTRDQIHVAVHDSLTEADLATETGISPEQGTPIGGFTGGFTGALIGLFVGMLGAWVYGTLVLQGIAPAIIIDNMQDGVIAGAIFGVAIGIFIGTLNGMLGGSMEKTLENMDFSENEATAYEQQLRQGKILLIISEADESKAEEIRKIMNSHGAQQTAA